MAPWSAFLCAALAVPAAAQTAPEPVVAERVFTYEDAERLALLNNAGVLSAEQDIVIAEQRVKESWFQFYPEVGLQASATRFDARYPFALSPEFRSVLLFPSNNDNIYSGRAYFNQSLYEGRRHLNLLRLSQTALKQAKSQYEAVRMDTVATVKRVFYRLILAQETQAAAAERLAAASSAVKGGLSSYERIEAEGLLASLRARAALARHSVELAQLEFRKGLNLELDIPVRLVGSLEAKRVDVDLDKAIIWASELRPELQAETYKAQMDAISVNLAIGRRNPTLYLAGDYEVTGQRFPLRQNNWDATVGIKIPFSYDLWTQIKQRRAEQRQGEIKRAEIHDKVRLEVRQAHEQLGFWQAQWPEREKEYLRIKSLVDSAAGGPGGLPAVRAQAVFLDVQERYLTSVEEALLAQARLERAVGRALAP